MKRLLGILFFLLVPALSFAASIDCSRVAQIKINQDNYDSANTGIQIHLSNYRNHLSPDGSAYWLCFKFIDNPSTDISNFTLNTSASDKPVFISGLALNGLTGPLILKGGKPITLLNSSFTGCPNCLWMDGIGHTAENIQIDCSDKTRNGIGIKLTGQNHKVLKTTIQQCKVGLQIGDGARPGNNMQVEQDTAFSNGTAFKLVYGWGNFFKYNSVFENDANNDGIFAGEEGIFFEEAVNADMTMPILLNDKDEIYTGKDDESVLRYSAACDPDKKEWSEEAVVKFKTPYPISETELSLNGENIHHEDQYQGKEFFKKIECIHDDRKDTGNFYNIHCTFRLNEKTQSFWTVLLSHQATFGSSPYSLPFKLNGPCGPGILSAADQGAAGAAGGASDPGVIEVASAGGVLSEPASVPADSEEEEKDSGNSIDATTPTGDTAASALTGGISATGAPGGVGGCGASLYAVSTSTSIPTLLPLLMSLFSLIKFRNKKP